MSPCMPCANQSRRPASAIDKSTSAMRISAKPSSRPQALMLSARTGKSLAGIMEFLHGVAAGHNLDRVRGRTGLIYDGALDGVLQHVEPFPCTSDTHVTGVYLDQEFARST